MKRGPGGGGGGGGGRERERDNGMSWSLVPSPLPQLLSFGRKARVEAWE